MATLYKGDVSVRETYDSRCIRVDDKRQTTFRLAGKYADLAEMVPKKGDKYKGLSVVSASLQRDRGLMGTLEIVCHGASKDTSAAGTGPKAIDEIFEIDCATLEKPLLAKDTYGPYGSQIAMWKAAPAELYAQKKYLDPQSGEAVDLDGPAAEYATLVLKGIESYMVFAPVVRVVTTYDKAPKGKIGGGMCKRVKPPAKALALLESRNPDWAWLKIGDTCAYNSDDTYTRTETWQAADKWDETVYPD